MAIFIGFALMFMLTLLSTIVMAGITILIVIIITTILAITSFVVVLHIPLHITIHRHHHLLITGIIAVLLILIHCREGVNSGTRFHVSCSRTESTLPSPTVSHRCAAGELHVGEVDEIGLE